MSVGTNYLIVLYFLYCYPLSHPHPHDKCLLFSVCSRPLEADVYAQLPVPPAFLVCLKLVIRHHHQSRYKGGQIVPF